MREETGIYVSDLKRIKALPPIAGSPNRSPNLLHIYQIDFAYEEFLARERHDDEIEEVVLYGFDEIRKMMAEGLIYVAVPMAVVSRFLLLHS